MGGKRIRGELLKLGLTVAKHTIQKYINQVRPPKPASPTWTIFLKNHTKDIRACEFLPFIDRLGKTLAKVHERVEYARILCNLITFA